MKKLMMATLLSPLLVMAQQKDHTIRISGRLENVSEPYVKVYALYTYDGKKNLDSATIFNNEYAFSLSIDAPLEVMLFAQIDRSTLKGPLMVNNRNRATVYVSPGKIAVTSTGDFSNITVKGSKAHDVYTQLNKQAAPYRDQIQEISKNYYALGREGKKAEADALKEKMQAIQDEMQEKVYGEYVRKNPNSPMALFALQFYGSGNAQQQDKAISLFSQLPKAVQQSSEGHAFITRLQGKRNINVGRIAPDFMQNDTAGNPVKLSSFRGKYVLLDFWASWCGPCRKENPNVVKAFNQYKDKGFTVLGVSLDKSDDQAKWLKAIHDDGLTWTHVSDLKYWSNEAALLYGVSAVPQNFLLDREGKIIAINLRGDALLSKLEEVLN